MRFGRNCTRRMTLALYGLVAAAEFCFGQGAMGNPMMLQTKAHPAGTALTVPAGSASQVQPLSNIRFADQFSGSDCGAKIKAANDDLGSSAGEIWVSQLCGTTISTSVTLGAGRTLRFVQGAIYKLRATLTLVDNDSIVGPPAAVNEDVVAGLLNPQVTLQQPASTNLPEMVLIKGQNIVLENFALDGNARAGGNGLTVGIAYDNSDGAPNNRGRLRLKYITVENCGSDNVQITSDTNGNNQAIGAYIQDSSLSRSSAGNGITITRTSDVKIWRTSFELNGRYGVRSIDSSMMVAFSDISANATGQVYASEDLTSHHFIYMQNGPTLFNNGIVTTAASSGLNENLNSAVIIDGYNGADCNHQGASVVTNNVISVAGGLQDNAVDAIRITDSGSNRIYGNTIFSSNGPASRLRYGVNIGLVHCLAENSDNVFGNGFFGAFATAAYHFASTTDGLMNTIGAAPGEQRKRVVSCTTAARADATCNTTVSWATPLGDTSYTSSCSLDEPSHPAFVASTSSKTAASIVVTIENAPSNSQAASGTLNCIAIHD
jgi:hypothetical protein